jgi:hypothetical protein
MSRSLDALLSELAPPPVPSGLAGRAVDAALALAQAPALPSGAPHGPRRDRRGAWLRRPLIAGGVALGLAFSGAVAAKLAGVEVELPPKVQTVLAEVPFFGQMAKAEAPVPVPAPIRPRSEVRPVEPALAEAAPKFAEPDPMLRRRRARAVRRYLFARQMVAERRAAGLPTPRADRIEQVIERRLIRQGVLPVDPVERAVVREQMRQAWRERVLARRAGMVAPDRRPPMAAIAEADPPPTSTPGDGAMSTEALNRIALRRARAERMRAIRFERRQRWREMREQQMRSLEDNMTQGTEAAAR